MAIVIDKKCPRLWYTHVYTVYMILWFWLIMDYQAKIIESYRIINDYDIIWYSDTDIAIINPFIEYPQESMVAWWMWWRHICLYDECACFIGGLFSTYQVGWISHMKLAWESWELGFRFVYICSNLLNVLLCFNTTKTGFFCCHCHVNFTFENRVASAQNWCCTRPANVFCWFLHH